MRRVVTALTAALIAQQSAGAATIPSAVPSAPTGPPPPVVTASGANSFHAIRSAAAKRGMAHYNKKQFSLASYYLRAALEADSNNAHLYYYLANSYVHVKRHEEAIVCYRRSYQLDPFGTVSGFCRQALLAYNVAIPEVSMKAHRKPTPAYKPGSHYNKQWPPLPVVAEPPTAEEAVSEEEDSEGEEQPKSVREQTVHEHHMNNATAMIRRQAEDEKARKKLYVDNLSDNIVKTGAAKASRIKAEAEEQIKEMYEGPLLYDSQGNARGRGLPHWRLNPILQDYLKEQAEQIRREAESRAQLEISMSHDKSSEYKKWYLDREGDIDYVADSLESQLRITKSRSGILLNPIGTGLYVRNYSTFKPKYPIPEAHSSVVRMLDRGFHEMEESESTFKEQPLKRFDVKGKVLSN